MKATREAVRAYLLGRLGLASDFRGSALELVRRLEAVQIDPVATVERNQHLVLGARLPGYRPADLEDLLASGHVFEYWANAMCVMPMEDYPLFEPMRRRFAARLQPSLERLGPVVHHVLERLDKEGPLPARAFETEQRVAGYWDREARSKATSHALNVLLDAGRIMVARRMGAERHFDLPERVVPARFREPADEPEARLMAKYVRAVRIVDATDPRLGWAAAPYTVRAARRRELLAGAELEPLEIEGVKRTYYVPPDESLEADAGDGISFLPPLDNLLWSRRRIADLFGFDYTWEVYTPACKRRYGHYAMPILRGDRLIGRIDPRLDRAAGRLAVQLLQIEPGVRWSARLRSELVRALDAFAERLGARSIEVGATEPPGWRL